MDIFNKERVVELEAQLKQQTELNAKLRAVNVEVLNDIKILRTTVFNILDTLKILDENKQIPEKINTAKVLRAVGNLALDKFNPFADGSDLENIIKAIKPVGAIYQKYQNLK